MIFENIKNLGNKPGGSNRLMWLLENDFRGFLKLFKSLTEQYDYDLLQPVIGCNFMVKHHFRPRLIAPMGKVNCVYKNLQDIDKLT